MAEREGFEPPIALRLCLISSQVHSTGLCHLSALYNPFIIYSINNLSATIPQRISCAGDCSICSNVDGCIEGIHHVRRYLVRTRHDMRISHRHLNGRVSYLACYCGRGTPPMTHRLKAVWRLFCHW